MKRSVAIYLLLLSSIALLPTAIIGCCPSSPPAWQEVTTLTGGAWNWFQDPKAVRYVGTYDNTYWGWVDKTGSIWIGSYNHKSQEYATFKLHDTLDYDDHAAPAILVRNDRKLVVFYSAHNANTMYWRISVNTEDISAFGEEKSFTGGGIEVCYPQVVQLSSESNKTYLFYRKRTEISGQHVRERWAYRTSTDGGDTFSSEQDLLNLLDATADERTYVKVISDGSSKIHFAATYVYHSSDPPSGTNQVCKHIYYFYYYNGNYYKANGTLINATLPLVGSDIEKVYDSDVQGQYNCWVYDIALDSANPCIVFDVFVSSTDHHYYYAKWNGSSWAVNEITAAGTYLYADQPCYGGGISLDKESPSTVYLSKVISSQWEIQKWTTSDGGATWGTPVNITSGSSEKNIRPGVVKNHHSDLVVFWMYGDYASYTNYNTSFRRYP